MIKKEKKDLKVSKTFSVKQEVYDLASIKATSEDNSLSKIISDFLKEFISEKGETK